MPPARSGNVNVNPLRIVAKAGVDGSRADRESCSQESTTAGGSSRLSLSRLVRCPCYGLHFLCVAKSTQRYMRVRRAPCSPAVRERWAHCHPLCNPTLCRAGAAHGLAHAAARSVPEYSLPVTRRTYRRVAHLCPALTYGPRCRLRRARRRDGTLAASDGSWTGCRSARDSSRCALSRRGRTPGARPLVPLTLGVRAYRRDC